MATQVLLIKDVQDLGRSGDVVGVKAGYARNYLIPRGFGYMANRQTLRIQARLQEERAARAAEDRKEAEKQAQELQELTLTAIVKVDPEGHMYGSVSAQDILKLVAEKGKIELEKRSIQLKAPIKQLGVHKVTARLKEGVEATFSLKVQTEDGRTEPIKAKEQESSEPAAAD